MHVSCIYSPIKVHMQPDCVQECYEVYSLDISRIRVKVELYILVISMHM